MTATIVRPVKSPAERLADLERDLADPPQAAYREEIHRAIAHIRQQMTAATILEA